MKRIDFQSAVEAEPVEIAMRIIGAISDALESQEAQIIITFKQDLRSQGITFTDTGVRIDYGACNTFIETGIMKKSYAEDTCNLMGVFRFLSKALAQRVEEIENETRFSANREIMDNYKRWTGRTDLVLPASIKDLADSMDIKDSSWWGLQREVGGGKSAEPARETSRPHTDPPQPETGPSGRTHA